MSKKKHLTDSQSELVATYLPQKLQRNRKLTSSVKLVLANIYQLYYFDKNIGKRTVFRTREDFMNDIEAKNKNELTRQHAALIQNDMVYIKTGVRGRATEYTLNDELYSLLPKQIRGEISDKFTESLKCKDLKINELQTKEKGIISPSHNELIHNEIWHLNVPSDTETETESETETIQTTEDKTEQKVNDMKQEVNNQQVQVPLSVECCYDEWVEVMDDDERKRQEQEYLQWVEDNKTNGSQRKLNNEYVSRMFEKFDNLLHLYSTSTSTVTANEYDKNLYNFIVGLMNERERFTTKQWDVIERKFVAWQAAQKQKEKYFRGQRKKTATVTVEQDYTSEVNDSNAHITSDNLISGSEDKGGRGAPLPKLYTTEMVEELCEGWTMEKLVNNGMETTIGKWQTALEKKTNSPICYDDFKNDVFDIIAHEPMVAYA